MPGINIAVQEEDFGGADKSWIRFMDGLDTMLPIVLDITKFSDNHLHFRRIPSGTPLGKVTATGLYGPYGGKTNEVQRIAVDATGGTFTITVEGSATAAIAFNASAAAVQAALELLPGVDHNDIVVSGGPGAAGGATPYVLTFQGQFAGLNVPQVTTGAGSLTGGAGTAAVTTATQGGTGTSDGTEEFAGFLFEDAEVNSYAGTIAGSSNIGAALMWEGGVVVDKLPVFTGTTSGILDDDAKNSKAGARFKFIDTLGSVNAAGA